MVFQETKFRSPLNRWGGVCCGGGLCTQVLWMKHTLLDYICIMTILKYFVILLVQFIWLRMQIIVKESMFHPKDLCTTSPYRTYSASAVERATEFCFLEDHETRQLPRNWHVSLVLFPIHSTTRIVGIRKTRHGKLSGLRIPQTHFNCALKVSNNAFYHNQMWLFRTRLKSSTKTHTKHNVRPTSH